nr:unnamed protein product [Digitaria exilis]
MNPATSCEAQCSYSVARASMDSAAPADDVDEEDGHDVARNCAAERDERLRAGEAGDLLDGVHGGGRHRRGSGDPPKLREEVLLEDALAVVGQVE